jgi:hypothetical protein
LAYLFVLLSLIGISDCCSDCLSSSLVLFHVL